MQLLCLFIADLDKKKNNKKQQKKTTKKHTHTHNRICFVFCKNNNMPYTDKWVKYYSMGPDLQLNTPTNPPPPLPKYK